MIYFDKPTREALLARYSRYMVDGGYLFIGHSESLGRVAHDFVYVKPAVYRKRIPQ
jgi:chemotaxis protein methyltransferase CheR